MYAELLLLRLVHVLGGLFWVGSGLFTALFLMPALAGAGPAAMGPVMGALQRRRLFTVLPTVAVLTIASGLRLLWIGSDGLEATYFATPSGLTFALSGAAATVAFLLSLLVVRPGMVRAGALTAEMASARDEPTRASLATRAAALRRRASVASQVAMVLLVLGAAGMAVGRYVRW
jgi:uncharacterized membrane protein